MIERCGNPNQSGYEHYGGRGIRVCKRWRESFQAFVNDVGERPDTNHTLERLNPDGNYEPGNVKWLAKNLQSHNRRDSIRLTVDGLTKRISEWAALSGNSLDLIRTRYKRRWPDKEAVFGRTIEP
jgi:hypothetical protein